MQKAPLIYRIFFTSSVILFLWNCTSNLPQSRSNSVKVGTISGPETDVMEVIRDVAKEQYDLEIEIVSFNDFVTPNLALAEGSLDANAFQHLPYLKEANKAHDFKLKSIGPTFLYPLAAYSKKFTSLEQLKGPLKISIPNDPSNGARALLLLEKSGIIRLKNASDLTVSVHDITEKGSDVTILELDAAQLPRTLDDVDLAVINTVFASTAGLNPLSDSLFREDTSSPYANIIAVKEHDIEAEWTSKFIQAAHHPKVALAAQKIFKGSAIPAWEQTQIR